MKIRYLLTFLTIATLLAACAPKNEPTPVPTMAAVMTETMASLEPSSLPTEVATATSTITPSGIVFDVEISGFEFEDATVTIKVGDTVKWTNHDGDAHAIVANDGSFMSPTLANDASFSFTFGSAGTYPYQCGIHSSMRGTVIVEP